VKFSVLEKTAYGSNKLLSLKCGCKGGTHRRPQSGAHRRQVGFSESFKRISVVTSGQWKVNVCFEQANCLRRKILISWYLKHAACVHKWLWSAWASSTRRFLLKSMTQFDECLYTLLGILRMYVSNSLYAVDGYSELNISPIIYDKPLVRFFRHCPFSEVHVIYTSFRV